MKVSSRSVLSFALVFNGVIAAPLNPRNVEVVTVTEVTTEVVRYTRTLWVDPTPVPGYGSHEGDEDHIDDIPTTSSVSIPETMATPSVSTSTSDLSVVPSSTLAYSSVDTTQQTTTSTPTTTTTTTTPTLTPTPTPLTTPTTTPPPSPPVVEVPTTTTEAPTTPPAHVPTTPAAVPTTTAPAPSLVNNPPPPPSYGGSPEVFKGEGTYYDTGMGSCGIQSTDSDLIVAISKDLMDSQYTSNPNNNPFCGKKILCSHAGGPEVLLTVTDRCTGCKVGDLDLSPAAFAAIGALKDAGRVPIEWRWA